MIRQTKINSMILVSFLCKFCLDYVFPWNQASKQPTSEKSIIKQHGCTAYTALHSYTQLSVWVWYGVCVCGMRACVCVRVCVLSSIWTHVWEYTAFVRVCEWIVFVHVSVWQDPSLLELLCGPGLWTSRADSESGSRGAWLSRWWVTEALWPHCR